LDRHLIVVVLMKTSRKSLILVAALAALPALAHAATTTPSSQPKRSLAQMDLAPRFYLKRRYAPIATAMPPSDTPVTTLSRQMASDGPIGSLGLINLSEGGAVNDRSFGDSLAAQRGLPSRALGFNVSYNFP
jgi:hypothetical protein